MTFENDQAHSVNSASQISGISRHNLYKMIEEVRLETIKKGKRVLICGKSLAQYIDPDYEPEEEQEEESQEEEVDMRSKIQVIFNEEAKDLLEKGQTLSAANVLKLWDKIDDLFCE